MNPRALSARPLLDTDADAALFVPLGGALDALVKATERGYSVLLHGPRGAGRTTHLRALMRQRRSAGGRPAVFVQAAGIETAAEFLGACAAALTGEANEAPPQGDRPGAATARLKAALEAPTLFLVDNLDPHVTHRVFGTGRDDMWELDASFVVTCLEEELSIVLAPPADAFFEAKVAVPRPSAGEAQEILTRRLGHPVDLAPANLTPRGLLDAARLDPDDPAAAADARSRRLTAAAAVSPSALAVGRLIEEFGSVAASDDRVRDRLGLSAARVSQILVQMYDENLLTFDDVRRSGPGRPTRRYRWAVGVTEGPGEGLSVGDGGMDENERGVS